MKVSLQENQNSKIARKIYCIKIKIKFFLKNNYLTILYLKIPNIKKMYEDLIQIKFKSFNILIY